MGRDIKERVLEPHHPTRWEQTSFLRQHRPGDEVTFRTRGADQGCNPILPQELLAELSSVLYLALQGGSSSGDPRWTMVFPQGFPWAFAALLTLFLLPFQSAFMEQPPMLGNGHPKQKQWGKKAIH